MKATEIKFYMVILEGIDKTGKDLIARYIHHVGGKRYLVQVRGPVSMRAYSKKDNRDYEYDASQFKNALHILLTATKLDWELRCKLSNEAPITYRYDTMLFENESAISDFADDDFDSEIAAWLIDPKTLSHGEVVN
jgi:hypothetical protein